MAYEWVITIENEWERERDRERRSRWCCIYRVPHFIRENRSEFFTPQVVSLGPYHHGNPELKRMEKLKKRMLGHFLAKIEKKLMDAVDAMEEKVDELMGAYDELDENKWSSTDKDDKRFVQLMVLDGCFLLVLLYFRSRMLEKGEPLYCCIEEMYPVFSSVESDIYLLENQVPARALQVLADLGGHKAPSKDVPSLLLKKLVDDKSMKDYEGEQFHHKLHAYWRSRSNCGAFLLLKPRFHREKNPSTVTELVATGVRIEKSDSKNSISFEKGNGVLKLPKITFDDRLELRYLNSMAFEKMLNLEPEIFTFVEFMHSLINTEKDAEILRQRGIIDGIIGTDAELASFFHRITKRAYPPTRKKWRKDEDDVAELLNGYCSKWQHKWLAAFKQLYLESAWAFTGFVAAFFLLSLTILSTVYTILGYYPH